MNFADAVKRERAALESRGYEGRYWAHGSETCGCWLRDLRPCGELKTGCLPAYQGNDGLMHPSKNAASRGTEE